MAARKTQWSLMPGHRAEAARLVIESGKPIAHVAVSWGWVSSCWAGGACPVLLDTRVVYAAVASIVVWVCFS
jgi:hypothetical protein